MEIKKKILRVLSLFLGFNVFFLGFIYIICSLANGCSKYSEIYKSGFFQFIEIISLISCILSVGIDPDGTGSR